MTKFTVPLHLDAAEKLEIEGILERLHPISLDEKIHMYLLSNDNDFYYLDTIDENGESKMNGYEIAEENSEELGENLSKSHQEYLVSKLREILSTQGDSSRHYAFGLGCAKGIVNHSNFWEELLDNLSNIPFERQRVNVIRGFIRHLSRIQPELTNSILDSLLHDERANKWFPDIQFSATLDTNAVKRLVKAIEMQISPIHFYQLLGYGRIHEALNDAELGEILNLINKQSDGAKVSIEILSMRFHGLKAESKYVPSAELKTLAQQTLLLVDFSQDDSNGIRDHAMQAVARFALTTPDNYEAARALLGRMIEQQPRFSFRYKYPQTLGAIIKSNPKAVLDCLLDDLGNCQERATAPFQYTQTPSIPLELISEWCAVDPSVRCTIVAKLISPYRKEDEVYQLSKEARLLLDISPTPLDVLEKLDITRRPSVIGGSYANFLESRLSILVELESHADSQVQYWASSKKVALQHAIDEERRWEEERASASDERFEW